MGAVIETSAWLSRRQAAIRLSITELRVDQLADAGEIAIRTLPGMPRRFSAQDVARLIAQADPASKFRSAWEAVQPPLTGFDAFREVAEFLTLGQSKFAAALEYLGGFGGDEGAAPDAGLAAKIGASEILDRPTE